MVIGTLEDGRKCVYDLPTEIKTAEQFKNLIYDYHDDDWAERTRPELFGQKTLCRTGQVMHRKNFIQENSRNRH